MANRPTPQTLTKAIENGIADYKADSAADTMQECVNYIKSNVADFIRNGVSPAHLFGDDKVTEAIDKFMDRLV